MNLKHLQSKLQDKEGFLRLEDYENLTAGFLDAVLRDKPTRIVSPDSPHYVFYQYEKAYGHRITRPLNTELLIEKPEAFQKRLREFHSTLEVLGSTRGDREAALVKRRLDPKTLDVVVYTIQQSLGSIGDSLADTNQSRKRVGQLFEGLVKLAIEAVGVKCEGRTVALPIPGHEGRTMRYELDMVLSKGNAIVAAETSVIAPHEIVGSVKTTSKDRMDKVFLDKFLMSKLLGRDVRVVALFLHDVQRAKRGGNPFGVASTFKTNHFLGYTIALNPLDGVYYVDPRPVMGEDPELSRQIGTFSRFLVRDLWLL